MCAALQPHKRLHHHVRAQAELESEKPHMAVQHRLPFCTDVLSSIALAVRPNNCAWGMQLHCRCCLCTAFLQPPSAPCSAWRRCTFSLHVWVQAGRAAQKSELEGSTRHCLAIERGSWRFGEVLCLCHGQLANHRLNVLAPACTKQAPPPCSTMSVAQSHVV